MSTSLNSVANVDEQGAETTVSATAVSESGSVLSTPPGNIMHRNDMQINVIKNFEDFNKAKEHWDSVYCADPESQFFLSWTWLSGYLRGSSNWFILSAKPNAPSSSPVAFFPLRLRMSKTEEGGICKEVAMAGNRQSDYTGLICIPEFQADAISAFANYIKRFSWDSLYLENILVSNERLILFLKHFPADSFSGKRIKLINKGDNIDHDICPYVDLPTEWENFFNINSGSNTRYKIRRFLRVCPGTS